MFKAIDEYGIEITIYDIVRTNSGLLQGVIFENGAWDLIYLDRCKPVNTKSKNRRIQIPAERDPRIQIPDNIEIEEVMPESSGRFDMNMDKFYDRGTL